MASAIIHIAVANEINKTLKRDNKKLLIGAIAPDISKTIGKEKYISHFSKKDSPDIPNIDLFLNKYLKYLDDDFVLGYYIHLYTDYLWFKYFITDFENKNHLITKLNGDIVKCEENTFYLYVYNDYTNLNIQVIDKYNLDLKVFYEELPIIDDIIDEIPIDKLQVLVDKMGLIISNSRQTKELIFDIKNIENFITISTAIILEDILNIKNNN